MRLLGTRFRGRGVMAAFQSSKLMARVRISPSAPMASSTQGERARLLTEIETGSIPVVPASLGVKCYGSTIGSNPIRWRSIRHTPARIVPRGSKRIPLIANQVRPGAVPGRNSNLMVGVVNQRTRSPVKGKQRGQHSPSTPNADIFQWQENPLVRDERRFDPILSAPDIGEGGTPTRGSEPRRLLFESELRCQMAGSAGARAWL